MSNLHLPDVSEFQANVTWPAVKNHNGGAAIIRVSYGNSHEDILWSEGRRASAEAAGMRALGFYHYLVATQDVLSQAAFFVKLIGSLKPGQFAVLDLEEGSGDQLMRAQEWLAYVDAHLTYPGYHGAWLYSGLDFAESAGLAPIFASTRHTWIAAYGPSEPSLGHSLWQHSNGTLARCSNEPWPGIGYCDCSQFDGTLDDFIARIYSEAPVSTGPVRHVVPHGFSQSLTGMVDSRKWNVPAFIAFNQGLVGKQLSQLHMDVLNALHAADIACEAAGIDRAYMPQGTVYYTAN